MSDKISYEPLVSVCIISYNSSEFIIDALDSVFEQTYGNIELFVSDDCSQDNTVKICRQWMDEHVQRFVHAEILTVDNNTGVSANCNRGIRKGIGKYIKYLAGDDMLLPNCIEDNVRFMLEHKDTDLLFSDMQVIGVGQDGNNIIRPAIYFKHLAKFEFKIWQLVYSGLPAPTCFMKREVYNRLGGFDEEIAFMEDKPFWVKAIWADCVIRYMPLSTVQYRINPNSLSQTKHSPNYHKMKESRKIASKYFLSKAREISWWLWAYRKVCYDLDAAPTMKNYCLYALRFFNPYYYYLKYLFYKLKVYQIIKV